jgi:hypothetical protein
MRLNQFIIFVLFALIFSLETTQCLAANADLYTGLPQFQKIPLSIKNSSLFKDAYLPDIKMLEYESTEIPSNAKYSKYQIHLRTTENKLAQYKTIELTGKDNRLFGQGIGYGGIFSMQYFKKGDLDRHKKYYKKYQWREISHIEGHLFPLKVGNRLSFDYKEAYKDAEQDEPITGNGKIVYEVTDVIHDYKNNFTAVPGNVYVIKFSKSTKENPRLVPQNIYHFSDKLGWYIYAKYFFAGKPLVEYKITNWS